MEIYESGEGQSWDFVREGEGVGEGGGESGVVVVVDRSLGKHFV